VTSDRSDGQQEQSHARHVLTKRPKHPGSTAAGALRGEPETQAALADAGVVVPVSRPVAYLGGGDIGCSSHESRRGARHPRDALSAHPVPCPSLGVARPMLLGEAIPRAPSLHRGGRHQAHRPRLERGDAPARGTRRGSTEGMAPWRHLTTGVTPGRARHGRRRSPPSHQTGRTRNGRKRP
jgi:hypothetical protein